MDSSTSLDPRQPVLVGVGQLNQRVDRGAGTLEPADLMVEAIRLAVADAGRSRLLDQIDAVRVVSILSWGYRDPGRVVADRLGLAKATTMCSAVGGNMPQSLVNQACRDLMDGTAEVIVVTGAEAWRSRNALRKSGSGATWTLQEASVPTATPFGKDEPLSHPNEVERGIAVPVQLYPIFESAWRASQGWTLAEHRRRLAELWAGFSAVAADNPHAWIRRRYTADELATVDDANRMIGFPYPKLLNSNNAVEQGAALILCTVEKARALGIPRDRWIFPHAGTDGHDTPFVSNRPTLSGSPAIRVVGRRALDLAATTVDDLAHVDVYSCFPVAVQVAAAEIGLDASRPLTITGGLSFAGGPWNNYVSHAIATMAERLRAEDPGAVGLCTANGGYLTKHAFGVYGNTPPAAGFRWEDTQTEIDAAGSVELCESFDGPVTVEAYTVMHGREGGPEVGLAAVRLDDGRRAWGSTRDPASLVEMEQVELVGRSARLTAEGHLSW